MRGKLGRITFIACCLAAVILPLQVLVSKGTDLVRPSFGPLMKDGEITGMEVSGKVAFYRGGHGPRAILIGSADFEIVIPGTSVSDSQILALLESGELPHGDIDWRIDWSGLVSSLTSLWFVTALFYWWLKSPEPVPGPSATDRASHHDETKRE